MKRLIALLLLLAFASCYIPTVKALLNAHNVCLVDMVEDNPNHKTAESAKDKKYIKECWGCLHFTPQEVTNKFSYIHNTHFLGDNPLADILTPPPNQA